MKNDSSLQKEMPVLRGFSAGNMRKMRFFYEQWAMLSIRSPMANELTTSGIAVESFITQASSLNLTEFAGISFTHHFEILSKTSSVDERLFYIHQAYVSQCDKYKLQDLMEDKE